MDKRYDELTDEQLVEEAQAESLEAEEYLIRKYKEVVRSRAKLYFIMGADGEDVVQEGMIGLFKAIKSYDCAKDASFHTFAELCINRQIITAIKTASRLKHSPLSTSISLNKPVSEEETDGTLEETLCSDSNSDPEAQLLLKDVVKSIIGNEGNIFSKFEMQVWNEYLTGKNYRQIAEGLEKARKPLIMPSREPRKKF